MNKLLHGITNFKERATTHLQEKGKNALKQIIAQTVNYEKFIAASDTAAAMLAWEKLTNLQSPKSTIIPALLRFGHLLPYTKNGKELDKILIPLLLPLVGNNAILFDMQHSDKEDVPQFFQAVALRFLLSMQMKVCKFYLIDTDFGGSFSLLLTINNPLLQYDTFYQQEDIRKLLAELEKIVNQANKSYLGKFPNLTSYNSSAGPMAQPYHFVFIDDFPNNFQGNTLDTLYNLINNNNAAKAGVHIFINYSTKNNIPRDFDIERFKKICACILSNAQGDVSFENWNFQIPQPAFKIVPEMSLPQNAIQIVDFINNIEEEKVIFSLDDWIDDLKKNRQIWKDTTVNGIKVPVGFISPTQHFEFYLANDNDSDCKDYFALVAGLPRYGKTVLLHNIIVNACMKYSPEELNLYLADFAEGASFSIYRDLPHTKALMLSNNKEYALRMLEYVVAEAKHRSHLYQKAQKQYGQQVSTFASYRKITGEKLPRILIVMDEFHYLFNSVDMISIKAREELCNGIRQWGKFGISIILCTQSISGVNFGNTADFITYRFALCLLEMDSKTVIRNAAAKSLTRKGQIIMNNSADGNEQLNVEFQCAFTPRYLEHVQFLSVMYKKNFGELPVKYICEPGTYADISDNIQLSEMIAGDNFTVNHNFCDVYVGKPDLLRDSHTRIRYRRQQNSNTIYIGEDFGTAINSIALSLLQIHKQSHTNSKFYVMDCFNAGDEFQGVLNCIADYSPNFVIGNAQSVPDCVNTIAEELEKRKQNSEHGQQTEERIVLTILNTQNCYELRPQGSGIMPMPSATATQLAKILAEGAPLGVHCIIHSLNYASLVGTGNIFDSKTMNNFENKIFLKGADIQNMLLGGIKIGAVEENGIMIVLNNKIDGESYEQCKSYNEITVNGNLGFIDFMSDLFERNCYA